MKNPQILKSFHLKSNNWRKLQIGLIAAFLGGFILVWLETNHKEDGDHQTAEKRLDREIPRKSAKQNEGLRQEWVDSWKTQPDSGATQQLIDQLIHSKKIGPASLLEGIASAYENDPSRYHESMIRMAEELFEHDPAGTMSFLARLHASPGIVPLERTLMNRWVQNDVEGVLGQFSSVAAESNARPFVQLAFVSSICQHEQQSQLPEFLAWIEDLPKEQEGIRNAALEALVETSSPANFTQLDALFKNNLQDQAVSAWASQLVSRQVDEQPDEALEWIRTAPSCAGRTMMLEDVMGALSRSHPEMAAELINQPDELFKLFGMPGGPPQEALRDRALVRLLEATMGENPEYAMEVASYFSDPKLASDYTEKASRLIQAKKD
ncbi:hypothetical protein JIN85_06635 [Luteolibacter pohnpeiensis]|uniref:Uncharacterized protein n=1 Tax=Luteolibacter pohnpeiensis TaxID=454153 RepID=A0A934VVS2_9BACT|nr:hypothetical protein [Luteolibacter pohnpeiensis]MBK1882083.1 hypothetical protein [Luteolibacter pohnpeiensis]